MKNSVKKRWVRVGASIAVVFSLVWAVGCHFHIHHPDYYESDSDRDPYDEHRPYGTVGYYPKHFY